MKNNYRRAVLMGLLLVLFDCGTIPHALEVGTHEEINLAITKLNIGGFELDSYLRNQLGFRDGVEEKSNKLSIKEWLALGGRYEDKPPWIFPYLRSVNHFLNPITDKGFSGFLLGSLLSGDSSKDWAQKPRGAQSPGGPYSWNDARGYFYKALTATERAERDNHFSDTFRAMGQLMHLVQDASVPAHTRNDFHHGKEYEWWVLNFYPISAANPVIFFDKSILSRVASKPSDLPIANIFDTNQFTGQNPEVALGNNIGLAEYSNPNFFSVNTTISTDFTYPKIDPKSIVKKDCTSIACTSIFGPSGGRYYYLKNCCGETNSGQGYLLANVDYLDDWRGKNTSNTLPKIPLLDGNVYADYASLLIPRAIGYSAGLLQYFFRASIEITLPDSGVYAQTDNVSQKFTQVKLKAKNITPNDEEMSDGTIDLVVKYKMAHENPFQSKEVETDADFTYIVVRGPTGVRSIARDQPTELVFDMTSYTIPLYATDVYLQVVYHGKLGKEINGSFVGESDGAVAVGFKDIGEPTPIDLFNDMDRICLNGGWYDAGSREALNKVDTNKNGIADEWDIYPHDLIDSFVRISPINSPQKVSPSEYNFYAKQLDPGTFLRAGFILTDYNFVISFTGSPQKIDDADAWAHFPGLLCGPGYATQSPCQDAQYSIKNQTDLIDGKMRRTYPTFNVFRGREIWGGEIVENYPYPLNSLSACPQE